MRICFQIPWKKNCGDTSHTGCKDTLVTAGAGERPRGGIVLLVTAAAGERPRGGIVLLTGRHRPAGNGWSRGEATGRHRPAVSVFVTFEELNDASFKTGKFPEANALSKSVVYGTPYYRKV